MKTKVWDFWAKRYKKLWVQKYSLKPTREMIKNLLIQNEYNNKSLLDIGCGVGQLLYEISSLDSINLYGLDFSKEMIEESKKLNPDVTHFQLDVEDMLSIGLKFDYITCTHSFPYYTNKKQVLSKIFQLLEKDGKLFISFASGDSYFDKLILFFVKFTTGYATYPSDIEFRSLIEGLYLVENSEIIKEKFYMPRIVVYSLKKVKE